MEAERIRQALTGVVATSLTPFTATGEVDHPGVRKNAAELVAAGIDVVVPCGNTGEHSSLADDEARRVAEAVIDEVAGRAVVFVGVGGALPTVLEQVAGLRASGADGVMVHQPAHPMRSHEGVARYLEAICDAAEGLAVIPYKRDPAVMPDDLLERLAARPNVLGVKYASPDVRALQLVIARTRERRPDLAWVNGLAETWAPAFHHAGAPGFSSGLCNVAPRLSVGLRDALRAGDRDEVDRLWRLVTPFEQLRARHDAAYNVPVVKEAAAQLGLCERTVRPPLAEVDADDRDAVAAILHQWSPA